MRTKPTLLIAFAALCVAFAAPVSANLIIEDFETDNDLNTIYGFSPAGPVFSNRVVPQDISVSNVPGSAASNSVMQAQLPSSPFAGVGRTYGTFQDWSAFNAIYFWLFGTSNGNELTFNIRDRDTLLRDETWVSPFVDDFSGWKLIKLPFADFIRPSFSPIGNGEFDIFQITEWSFFAETRQGNGVVATDYLLDDIALVQVSQTGTLALLFLCLAGIVRSKQRGQC